MSKVEYKFFLCDTDKVYQEIGAKVLLEDLQKMVVIRHLETRAESAYQHGKVGGFFHSSAGQEAIATSLVRVFGNKHWYTTTYRCHALAYLLGISEKEIMAELYGKEVGNAKGRGGSMHLFSDRLLGGLAIVGGHIPIATGAAFSLKYQGRQDLVSLCFLGDGAVAQGAFHESLNLASLWNLPCVYIIENNLWGMGTHVSRAICKQPIAESFAPGYGIKSYTLNGMDYFNCYAGFQHIYREIVVEKRPILVEVVGERFRGHSISDPALYRTKGELQEAMKKDPLLQLRDRLIREKALTAEEYQKMDKEVRERVIDVMKYAQESLDPNPISLEEGVFAP